MNKRLPAPTAWDSLTKADVRAIADGILTRDADAVHDAVSFVCVESINLWHGRGRAMMCRRLKHVDLSRNQSAQLVGAILERLVSGRFSEQFRDQLQLAIYLDPESALVTARRAAKSDKPYVRRLADWTIAHAEAAK